MAVSPGKKSPTKRNGQQGFVQKGPLGEKATIKKAKDKQIPPKGVKNDPQPSTSSGSTQQNDQEDLDKKAKREKAQPEATNDNPQPSSNSGTSQQNDQEEIEKAILEYEAKLRNDHSKSANNDPQPSANSSTSLQNGQEKLVKKAKWNKGQPKAANKDPQPSKSNETAKQNDQEELDKLAKLAEMTKELSELQAVLANKKEVLGIGTNELEFCEPVEGEFELTSEQKASGIKSIVS